jgi:hypothetical protein
MWYAMDTPSNQRVTPYLLDLRDDNTILLVDYSLSLIEIKIMLDSLLALVALLAILITI